MPAKKSSTTSTSDKSASTKSPAKKAASAKAATKKASGAATTADEPKGKPLFGQRFLDQQKKLLLEEREKYVASAASLKAEADSLVEEREPGDVQFDEESGEGDTLAVERERDLALSNMARDRVDEIDSALARIEAGTYGVCVQSGEPIPKERLEAIPWAAERVEYKAGGFRRR